MMILVKLMAGKILTIIYTFYQKEKCTRSWCSKPRVELKEN